MGFYLDDQEDATSGVVGEEVDPPSSASSHDRHLASCLPSEAGQPTVDIPRATSVHGVPLAWTVQNHRGPPDELEFQSQRVSDPRDGLDGGIRPTRLDRGDVRS